MPIKVLAVLRCLYLENVALCTFTFVGLCIGISVASRITLVVGNCLANCFGMVWVMISLEGQMLISFSWKNMKFI